MTEKMTAPDFDAMTLDDIDAWSAEKKREIMALQESRRLSSETRHRKVHEQDLAEATKWLSVAAEKSGRTLEAQAWYWLADEVVADVGHRVQAGVYLRSLGKLPDTGTGG